MVHVPRSMVGSRFGFFDAFMILKLNSDAKYLPFSVLEPSMEGKRQWGGVAMLALERRSFRSTKQVSKKTLKGSRYWHHGGSPCTLEYLDLIAGNIA